MEEEIKEKLNYKKFVNIEVKFIDLRKYKIKLKIDSLNIAFDFEYKWNGYKTNDNNISDIKDMIDYLIIKNLKEE